MSNSISTQSTKLLIKVRERPEFRSWGCPWVLVLDCETHYLETLKFCPTRIEDCMTRQSGFVKCAKCGYVCQVENGRVVPLAGTSINQDGLNVIQKHLATMPLGRCLMVGIFLDNSSFAA
jgi:hypothetical protein